jgi:hypothetical protein
MVAADDAKDSASVLRAGFIDLGTIKGNLGDQYYTLNPEVDLSKYSAVSVWCKRFSVNFGAARLMPDQAIKRCRRSSTQKRSLAGPKGKVA